MTPQADGRHSAVGLCVPVGRITAQRFREVVRLAREYGTNDGEIRLTHQQNVLIPWVPNERVEALLAEPLLAGALARCRRCSPAASRPAPARSSAAWRRSTPRTAPGGSPASSTSTCATTATGGPARALRRLLVVLRAAPDRRHRHRGRAQEGRRRVRRGHGHPRGRAPRARSALRRRRGQEGPRTGTSTRRCCGCSTSTSRRTTPEEDFAAFAARTPAEWWSERLARGRPRRAGGGAGVGAPPA